MTFDIRTLPGRRFSFWHPPDKPHLIKAYSPFGSEYCIQIELDDQDTVPVELTFKPCQSLMLTLNEKGTLKFDDICFMPKIPSKE
ncbi:MAG: hypothetical protein NT040_19715 [Bacteroidetes bacterium]|nr:hypothetical protein [Bacteroidota bacterium]